MATRTVEVSEVREGSKNVTVQTGERHWGLCGRRLVYRNRRVYGEGCDACIQIVTGKIVEKKTVKDRYV